MSSVVRGERRCRHCNIFEGDVLITVDFLISCHSIVDRVGRYSEIIGVIGMTHQAGLNLHPLTLGKPPRTGWDWRRKALRSALCAIKGRLLMHYW